MSKNINPIKDCKEYTSCDLMSISDYHKQSHVGKSMLFNMKKSPKYYKWKIDNFDEENTKSLNIGTAFHKIVLEPELFITEFAVAPVCDKRTVAGKSIFQSFELENKNKNIISQSDFEIINDMKKSIYENNYIVNLINNSIHERSYFWTDEKTGIPCKCRPDMIDKKNKLIIDLKSCKSVDVNSFSKDCLNYGYHLQVAHYLTLFPDYEFMFICVEKTPPYLVNIFKPDKEFVEQGNILKNKLLLELKECTDLDNFYGYQGIFDNNITKLSLPKWSIIEEEDDE